MTGSATRETVRGALPKYLSDGLEHGVFGPALRSRYADIPWVTPESTPTVIELCRERRRRQEERRKARDWTGYILSHPVRLQVDEARRLVNAEILTARTHIALLRDIWCANPLNSDDQRNVVAAMTALIGEHTLATVRVMAMDDFERAALDALTGPVRGWRGGKPLTVYRGESARRVEAPRHSWTLDRDVALGFADPHGHDGRLVTATVDPSRALWMCDRRRMREIVVPGFPHPNIVSTEPL